MYGQIIKVTIISIIKGIQLFSSNNWLSRKNVVPLQTEQTIINMEKEYIKQHGREFMVNGIRKMGFLGVILLCSIGVSLAQGKKESKTRYYRHEISLGPGLTGMRTGWSDDYVSGLMDEFGLISGAGYMDGFIYEGNKKLGSAPSGDFMPIITII